MSNNNENKTVNVALYCRLSKEDEKEGNEESASIGTQKAILESYARQRNWHIVDFYIDDGYSGTNFNRPDFQRMIKDIEAGKINCVVTKDLSRLGRNYLDCGLYLEVFFPEHKVRYISVNDGVDTSTKAAMDITPFKNILNEMYAADISTKVKSALKIRFKAGKFMGVTAPYGYLKDPEDHNHLIIDEKVAPIIRKIYSLALDGQGIAKIRHYLNDNHIMRPAAYAAENGAVGYERYFTNDDENRYRWSENGVRMILRSQIYCGNLVGYKRVQVSMKSKKRPSTLPENWEVVPNTHEPIVSQEVFDRVQKMMTSRRRNTGKSSYYNIFAGVVFCADCGYAMRVSAANRRKRENPIDCVVYSCNNYGRYGNINCTAHTLEARDLYDTVLKEINRLAKYCLNDEKAIKTIQKKLSVMEISQYQSLEAEKKKLNKRLSEIDTLFTSLYEDKVMGKIPERNYTSMSEKFQAEQATIEARLCEINVELDKKKQTDSMAVDFATMIKKYNGLTELNTTIINELIEKITVSERTKNEKGEVEQVIKIYFKLVGNIPGDLHIPTRKRLTILDERVCEMCGKPYIPKGGKQKYCLSCRVISHQQQAVRANIKRTEKRHQQRLLIGFPGFQEKTCSVCGQVFKPNSGHQNTCAVCVPKYRKISDNNESAHSTLHNESCKI